MKLWEGRPSLRAMMPWLAGVWAAVVIALVIAAHPAMFSAEVPPDYHARPLHPLPHEPVHGPAYDPKLTPLSFEYRFGPERTGVSTQLFQPMSPHPAWAFRPLNVGIHDASKASPAVDDTGIYVGADSSWFYALNLDGSVRWKLHVSSASRGIHSTVALDERRVYLGAYNGTFYALAKADARVAWTLRLGDTVGSSPVIDGDSLYVSVETFKPPDGFVARIRRDTGHVVWLSAWLGEQSHSSPTLDRAHQLVMAGSNNGLYRAFHVADGTEAWRVATEGAVKDTGCLVDGTIYFTSFRGWIYAVRAADGHELWHSQLPGPTRSSPAFVPSLGYLVVGVNDGSIVAVNAATGARVWTTPTHYDNMIASALVEHDAANAWYVWMTCGKSALCALRASSGEIVQQLDLDGPLTGVPTAFHDSLFVALDAPGALVRFDAAPPR